MLVWCNMRKLLLLVVVMCLSTLKAQVSRLTTRVCVDGEVRGENTCSFICGLNGQFYPGASIESKRCQSPGTPVPHQCAEICLDGAWLSPTCAPCCTSYPDNHCDITCDGGIYKIEARCDPLKPPTTQYLGLTTNTSEPCKSGDVKGNVACSFICGLNDQWYSRDESGREVGERCQRKGEIIPPLCTARVCYDGKWLPMPCRRCCQQYPENHCTITCSGSGEYSVQNGCDPFNPLLKKPPSSSTTCTDGDIRGQKTCGYICGLNNQWYPQTASGEIVHSRRCRRQGQFVQGTCPEMCGAGEWHPLPCYRCCQEYPQSTPVAKLLKLLCDSD